MSGLAVDLPLLRTVNESAPFNRWVGFEVVRADRGEVDLRAVWREEFAQYAGFLHAGLITALVDTACGFAAATVTGGQVTASHCAVNFLAPARGTAFLARARVVRAGSRQVFTAAEVHAEEAGDSRLVATGETILVPLA